MNSILPENVGVASMSFTDLTENNDLYAVIAMSLRTVQTDTNGLGTFLKLSVGNV